MVVSLKNGSASRTAELKRPRQSVAPLNLNPNAALEIRGVSRFFGSVCAISNLNLVVPSGKIIALLGPSGCGKTTALRLIAGFDAPDAGTIAIGGKVVSCGASFRIPPEKRQVGMVFQEGALFPHLTVEQNVAYGLPRAAERAQRVKEALQLVGLADLGQRMPHELSGGQQQRVALARALAPRPQVLLLDEPFSNLDPRLREQVRDDVLDIIRGAQVTAIFVTHDQEEAMRVGDAIAVMHQGVLEQVDAPEEIFHRPATRFVAEFIGMVDFVPGERQGDKLLTEVGETAWPTGCDKASAIEIMVRPDCLHCFPHPEGQGIIKGREFRGAFYLYRVQLGSGKIVRCLHSHTDEYAVGQRVAVTLRDGHALRPFVNGKAVETDESQEAALYQVAED